MGVTEWTPCKVTIATIDGPRTEDGWTHLAAPGLAVVALPHGGFTVTHLASGRALPVYRSQRNSVPFRVVAEAIALTVASLADWSLDMESLNALGTDHRRNVVAVAREILGREWDDEWDDEVELEAADAPR